MKATAAAATKRQRLFLAGYVRKAKEGKSCAECGNEFPHYQLQFDHVRGKKRANVADLVHKGVSIHTMRAEIAKCEIVCCNCHAARTWHRAQLVAEPEAPDADPAALTLF